VSWRPNRQEWFRQTKGQSDSPLVGCCSRHWQHFKAFPEQPVCLDDGVCEFGARRKARDILCLFPRRASRMHSASHGTRFTSGWRLARAGPLPALAAQGHSLHQQMTACEGRACQGARRTTCWQLSLQHNTYDVLRAHPRRSQIPPNALLPHPSHNRCRSPPVALLPRFHSLQHGEGSKVCCWKGWQREQAAQESTSF